MPFWSEFAKLVTNPAKRVEIVKALLADIQYFSKLVVRRKLYPYQAEVANAIVRSVMFHQGREFAIMFPRQAGKNETQSQIEAYLLNLYMKKPGAQIVKAQPTYKPQALNAMMRLERQLQNIWCAGQWQKREGYLYQLGQAVITFFSAEPQAQAVGASATLLLECDEAQDVLEAEWDKKFVPMAASTNATIVYWGTAWTSQTLLARTLKRLQALEQQDGVKRVFVVTPDQVARDNPAYGEFVRRQVVAKGRQHPLVKTQYFNEEIDGEGGLFDAARRALMQGIHARQRSPRPGALYAFLLDVAGEDEQSPNLSIAQSPNQKRDSTSLTIVEVDPSTLADELIQKPTYKVADRHLWIGVKHTLLYGQILNLARKWDARYIVGDATGVGAGLVSFLQRAFPDRVLPFVFTAQSKSKLGWDFLAVVDSARFQDYADDDDERRVAEQQRKFCQYAILPGPGQMMRWGVPDGARDPATGELVHDDAVLSDALCSLLDDLDWSIAAPATLLHARDPLADIDDRRSSSDGRPDGR